MTPRAHLIRVFLVAGALAFLTACRPVVLSSSQMLSPDGRLTATLEHVDNDLGLGQGALYDEVHVTRTWSLRFLWSHGDPDSSVVFYVGSSYAPGDAPRVRWEDSHHLAIAYPRCHVPGRALQDYRGVHITYSTFYVPEAMYCSLKGPNFRWSGP
jgi:hypothetical protein